MDDRTPFGKELIEKVADALQQGRVLAYYHREYCGHGLSFQSGYFVLGELNDGECYATAEELRESLARQTSVGPALGVWDSRAAFVELFAAQSDESCSGTDPKAPLFFTEDSWVRGNQRITRQRLLEFVSPERSQNSGAVIGIPPT